MAIFQKTTIKLNNEPVELCIKKWLARCQPDKLYWSLCVNEVSDYEKLKVESEEVFIQWSEYHEVCLWFKNEDFLFLVLHQLKLKSELFQPTHYLSLFDAVEEIKQWEDFLCLNNLESMKLFQEWVKDCSQTPVFESIFVLKDLLWICARFCNFIFSNKTYYNLWCKLSLELLNCFLDTKDPNRVHPDSWFFCSSKDKTPLTILKLGRVIDSGKDFWQTRLQQTFMKLRSKPIHQDEDILCYRVAVLDWIQSEFVHDFIDRLEQEEEQQHKPIHKPGLSQDPQQVIDALPPCLSQMVKSWQKGDHMHFAERNVLWLFTQSFFYEQSDKEKFWFTIAHKHPKLLPSKNQFEFYNQNHKVVKQIKTQTTKQFYACSCATMGKRNLCPFVQDAKLIMDIEDMAVPRSECAAQYNNSHPDNKIIVKNPYLYTVSLLNTKK